MNATAEICPLHTSSIKVVTTLAYTISFILSLIGNILVVVVVHRNKSLRNSTNYFIVNMAISDLLVPILVIPRIIKEIIMGSPWEVGGPFGEVLCKTIYFLSDIAPVVSIFSLIFISVDRFCAVVFPMKRSLFTTRVRAMLIGFTWFASFGICAPYFYAFKLLPLNGSVYCAMYWGPDLDHTKTHKEYTTFLTAAIIITPFTILAVIYGTICVVLVKRKVVGENIPQLLALRANKARKVIKLAVTVVAVAAVCWIPYGTFLLLLSFKWKWVAPTGCSYEAILFTIQFMALSNAALNPTVYFIFIQSYRQGLKRVMTTWGNSWRRLSSHTSTIIMPKQLKRRTMIYELNISALNTTQKVTKA